MLGILYIILVIIGFVIVMVGVAKESDIITGIGLCIFIIFILVGICYTNENKEEWTTEVEYDIWSTDAPFGYYWTHTESSGYGFLIAFNYYSDSQLTESYTVKYLVENDQLKTIIFPSDSEEHKVFLTEDVNNMTIKHIQQFKKLALTNPVVKSWYEIYIPNPKLFEELNK